MLKKRFWTWHKGGGVVETPIVLMLLCTLFMFFVGFCYSYFNKSVMNMAVHAGAREYSVKHDKDMAVKVAENELQLGGVQEVVIQFDAANKRVVATKDIGFYIPLTGKYLFHLESKAEFQEEYEADLFRLGVD